MVICNKCKLEKNESEFSMDRSRKNGLNKWCRECHKIHKSTYRNSNKGMYQNIIYNMYQNSLRRAQEKNLEHTITVDWITNNIPTHYKYTKNLLTFIGQHKNKRQDRVPTNISIDRINPMGGYIPDNVQFISLLANTLKSDMSEEDFLNKFPNFR